MRRTSSAGSSWRESTRRSSPPPSANGCSASSTPPRRAARSCSAIEAVAEWTLSVARHTLAAPERLEPECDRLREHVLPHWPDAPADLADALAAVPAVFQHGDLGSWNVVARPGGFTVLDWEDAVLDAPPLWDLWYLLADALAHLDV